MTTMAELNALMAEKKRAKRATVPPVPWNQATADALASRLIDAKDHWHLAGRHCFVLEIWAAMDAFDAAWLARDLPAVEAAAEVLTGLFAEAELLEGVTA